MRPNIETDRIKTVINLPIEIGILNLINEASNEKNINRSEYIRQAILSKLTKEQ